MGEKGNDDGTCGSGYKLNSPMMEVSAVQIMKALHTHDRKLGVNVYDTPNSCSDDGTFVFGYPKLSRLQDFVTVPVVDDPLGHELRSAHIIHILRQIADTLEGLWRKCQFTHGDMKCDQILLWEHQKNLPVHDNCNIPLIGSSFRYEARLNDFDKSSFTVLLDNDEIEDVRSIADVHSIEVLSKPSERPPNVTPVRLRPKKSRHSSIVGGLMRHGLDMSAGIRAGGYNPQIEVRSARCPYDEAYKFDTACLVASTLLQVEDDVYDTLKTYFNDSYYEDCIATWFKYETMVDEQRIEKERRTTIFKRALSGNAIAANCLKQEFVRTHLRKTPTLSSFVRIVTKEKFTKVQGFVGNGLHAMFMLRFASESVSFFTANFPKNDVTDTIIMRMHATYQENPVNGDKVQRDAVRIKLLIVAEEVILRYLYTLGYMAMKFSIFDHDDKIRLPFWSARKPPRHLYAVKVTENVSCQASEEPSGQSTGVADAAYHEIFSNAVVILQKIHDPTNIAAPVVVKADRGAQCKEQIEKDVGRMGVKMDTCEISTTDSTTAREQIITKFNEVFCGEPRDYGYGQESTQTYMYCKKYLLEELGGHKGIDTFIQYVPFDHMFENAYKHLPFITFREQAWRDGVADAFSTNRGVGQERVIEPRSSELTHPLITPPRTP
jgi:hypothetical protein